MWKNLQGQVPYYSNFHWCSHRGPGPRIWIGTSHEFWRKPVKSWWGRGSVRSIEENALDSRVWSIYKLGWPFLLKIFWPENGKVPLLWNPSYVTGNFNWSMKPILNKWFAYLINNSSRWMTWLYKNLHCGVANRRVELLKSYKI